MKPHRTSRRTAFRLAALLGLQTLAIPGLLHATTYTWSGGGDSDEGWSQSSNWLGGMKPPYNDFNTALVFTGTSNLAPQQNITSMFDLSALTFDNQAGPFVLGGPGALEFNTYAASGVPAITQNSGSMETINNALIFDKTTAVNGTGALVLGGTVSGAGGLTMSGTGTLTLTGGNTYAGGTTFASGTLNVGSAGALGTAGTLSFTGGTLQYSAANTTDYSARFSTAASQKYSVDTNGQNVTFATGLTSSGGSLTKLGAGTLTLSGANTYSGLTAVNGGTLLVTGSVFAPSGGLVVGDSGSGAVTLNSGSMNFINAGMYLGYNGGLTGTFNLNGGTLSLGETFIGNNGTGVLNQTGGTLTMNLARTLYVGISITGTGTYNLQGGTLTAGKVTVTGLGNGSTFAASTFEQSGGSASMSTLTLSGNGAAATYDLDGGTLHPSSVAGTGNDSVFHFNGGTLQAAGATTSFVSGLTTADVRNNGAVVDTNGFNVTIPQTLLHSTVSGDAATDGGLTKLGAGALTLSGANTFTGPTSINAGTLILANASALQNSTLNLSSGGGTVTFDSSVTGNAFTIGGLAGNANLALANNAATPAAITLTVGGNNASTAYSGALSGGGSLTKVGTGTLTLSGGGTLSTLSADGGTLVVSSGTWGTTYLQLGDAAAASTVNQTGGSITAKYVGVGIAAGGTYNLSGGTLTETNDLYVSNGANTGVFNQSGGTNAAREIELAGFGAGSVGIYNLNGGLLQTGLVRDNYPTSGGNGQFYFNGGTLQATISTTVFMQGLTTAAVRNGGAFIDTNGFNVTVAQSLSHSAITGDNATDGGLTKLGAGTLTLSGANTFNGPTSINAGTLILANANALQNSTLTLSNTGGVSVFDSSVSGNAFTLGGLAGNGNLALVNNAGSPANVGLTVGGNNASTTYSGILSGGSNLTKVGTGTLTLTGANTFSGPTTVRGGNLTLASGGQLMLYTNTLYVDGTNASFTLASGGSLTASNIYVGLNNASSATQTGGTFVQRPGSSLILGGNAGSSGSYTMSGGTLSGANLTAVGNLLVGDQGSGSFVQSGGTVLGSSLSVGYLAAGTYQLSGGSLTVPTSHVGDGNTGTFTQTGGTFAAGTLSVSGRLAASVGTYNLNGGTLNANSVSGSISGVSGTSTFNFNGGTLQAAASNSTFFQGLTTANVQAKGGTIDTNGYGVTVAQPLVHDTTSGAPSTDGGLTKIGAGTLTLSGANTYTGGTTVNAGTLLVGNTTGTGTGTGAVMVNGGAAFGGTGVAAGAVNVASGGTLSPGINGPGRLTLASTLNLNAGSTLAVELGGPSAGTQYDQIAVGGQLTLGGNLSVSVVNSFSLAVGQQFNILVDAASFTPVNGTFANAAGGLLYTDARGDTFTINYAANVDGGAVPNDVTLTVTSVVPEPSTWRAVGAGLLALLGVLWKRRRRA